MSLIDSAHLYEDDRGRRRMRYLEISEGLYLNSIWLYKEYYCMMPWFESNQ